MGHSIKGARHDSYRLILNQLELFDQCYLFACVPQLAAIGEDGEAYCFVGEPPLGLIKSSDGISEELEGLEGCSCSIAYHFYVVEPAEACVEEKT